MTSPSFSAADLAALEQARCAAVRRIRLVSVLVALVALAGLAVAAARQSWPTAIAVLGFGAIAAGGGYRWQRNRAVLQYKQRVLPSLVAAIDPSLRYRADGVIPRQAFEAAGLFASPDRYRGQDLVQGRIGQTDVAFSLVHAERREVHHGGDDGQRNQEHYVTLFRGLLLLADGNKHFSGRTRVRHPVPLSLDKLSRDHVALEDPRFNQAFSVSADDQVEARYLLTPAMMERLLALREAFGDLQCAWVDDKLLLALKFPADAFEPALFTPLTDPAQRARIEGNLRRATDVVDRLDLNTRIWSKTGPDA